MVDVRSTALPAVRTLTLLIITRCLQSHWYSKHGKKAIDKHCTVTVPQFSVKLQREKLNLSKLLQNEDVKSRTLPCDALSAQVNALNSTRVASFNTLKDVSRLYLETQDGSSTWSQPHGLGRASTWRYPLYHPQPLKSGHFQRATGAVPKYPLISPRPQLTIDVCSLPSFTNYTEVQLHNFVCISNLTNLGQSPSGKLACFNCQG